MRPRTVIYSSLWVAIGIVMLIALSMRERLDINVVPDRNPLFVTLSDGSIRNGYTLKVLNMEQRPRSFRVALEGVPEANMTLAGSDDAPARSFDIEVEADKLRSIKAYVSLPKQSVESETIDFYFVLTDRDGGRSKHRAIFHGPSNAGNIP